MPFIRQVSKKAIWLHIEKIFCVRTARRIKTAEKQKLRPKNKLFFGRGAEAQWNQSAAMPKNALRFGSSMARICVPSERRSRAQTAYLLAERADVSGALSASIST